MGDQRQEDFRWFVRNLDLLVEDIVLERHGVQITTLLDDADVVDAVLGMEAYFQAGQVDTTKFDAHGRPIVAALADAGWLGAFSMLQPHEDEFLGLLGNEFHIADNGQALRARVERFLEAVAVDATNGVLPRLAQGDVAATERLLRSQAGSAQRFFKALHCIRGDWRTRLARWSREGLLAIHREGHPSYEHLIRSEVFQAAQQGFEDERPTRTAANFADAVAFALLAELVHRYNAGERAIPRFFVSTSTFPTVCDQRRLQSKLSYVVTEAWTSSVFRDADYFVFRATFRPGISGVSSSISEDELVDLRSRIRQVLPTAPEPERLLDEVSVGNRTLGTLVKDLRGLAFLENVWLPAAAKTDVRNAFTEMFRATVELGRDTAFRKEVDKAVQDTKRRIHESVESYRPMKAMWSTLQQAERTGAAGDGLVDTERYWVKRHCLFRFGIPAEYLARVGPVLRDFYGKDEDAAHRVRTRVLSAWAEGLRGRPVDIGEVFVVAALLWGISEYRHLAEFLRVIGVWSHWSLGAIYAASVFDGGLDTETERAIVERQKVDALAAKTKDASALTAAAFLAFHEWLSRRIPPVFRNTLIGLGKIKSAVGVELIRLAMARAFDAAVVATDDQLRVYALNQYVYYWSEGMPGTPTSKVEQAALQLAQRKGDREVWIYRFDDTLARYYLRLALLARRPEKRAKMVEMSWYHNEFAVRNGPDDLQVQRLQADIAQADLLLSGRQRPQRSPSDSAASRPRRRSSSR